MSVDPDKLEYDLYSPSQMRDLLDRQERQFQELVDEAYKAGVEESDRKKERNAWIAGTLMVLIITAGVVAIVLANLRSPNEEFFLNDAGDRCLTVADATYSSIWPDDETVTLCEVGR